MVDQRLLQRCHRSNPDHGRDLGRDQRGWSQCLPSARCFPAPPLTPFTQRPTTATLALTSVLPLSAAGYVVLEDFATQDEVRQLRERAQAIMDARLNNDAAANEDAAIFSTVNQVGHSFDPQTVSPAHDCCSPADSCTPCCGAAQHTADCVLLVSGLQRCVHSASLLAVCCPDGNVGYSSQLQE